jgi:hypothetical protein
MSTLRTAVIDDETASQYYNELNTNSVEDDGTKLKALEAWADAKDAERNKQEWDHLTRVYTDFDNYISDEGYSDLDEESRYQIANRQFIANQLGETVEDQGMIYPAKRDIWTQQAFGKKGLSEKETFGLIQQGVQSRNEVMQSANEIPGDIALGLFDSIGQGTAVEVPKLVSIWKERNAEKLKKLPAGWESGLLQAASDYATETEGMLRNYSEPLKQVYDHLAAVTGRDTKRAGEDNPKSVQEIEALADTLATMPPEVRDRAYAAVVLGAKQAGQEPKEFLEQWGESWSRTLNMFRSGSMVMQEDAAYSELQLLKEAPKVWKDTDTGKLTVYPGFDQSNAKEITPEERTELTAEAQKKFDRLQVYRELFNIADNQFDPIKKINEGGFGGFMEAMAYGSPQALAYTGMALVPGVGPWMTGAAIYSEEYNKLRLDGVDPGTARAIAAPSAILQSGLERVGAKMIFGKLPAFEKLMSKIGNPARVGRAGSAGIRFGTAVVGENIVEGTQDLVTPVVQDVADALGADVPDVNWRETLGQWGTSRLDVLAATIPGILIGTGVATMADGKRFNDFNERLDLYRTFGMDEAAIKRVEDNQTPQDRQAALQAEYKKLTPDNIKAGISYMETKIDEAKSMQEDPTLPTMTREQGENGKPVFVVRDEKGTVAYRSEDEQSAMTAHREMLRTRITGATTGIVESLQFIDRVNQAISRGEDIQKLVLDDAPRNLLDEYEANPTEQNLDNLFQTVRAFGMDINEPSELAQFPVLASNQGALAEGIYRSVIRIQDGATGIEVMRDFSQDNLKRALAEGRVSMDWVREQLNQVIPLIESERTERKLRTETDTDVIESFSDVAVAYMNGKIRDEQIPGGLRGFLRRIAVVVKDIFRRAYRLKRAIAEGKIDSNFEGFLAESVGLNQQTMVDTTRERASGDIITDGGQMLMDFSIGSRTNAVSTDTPSIRASNATITGPANYSIGAFHGTPHKVDKFSLDKIGTGEGAQAYGWGLYFAQAKAVGEGYRDQLGGIRLMTADGQMADNIVSTPGAKKILKEARAFWKQTKSLDGFVKQLEASKSQSKVWAAQGDNVESNSQYVKDVDEVLSVIKDATPTQTGNLYSVELDVEPEELLDWDKPIIEQSRLVFKRLRESEFTKALTGSYGDKTAGEFYTQLSNINGGQQQASQVLSEAGIPGIRYLDGGSRSDGEGTHNYVVFDENLIKITEENGNRIPASEALAQPVSTDTNYSIGTPQFKGWFGESKVVDSDGKPMVVYHGTQRADRVGDRFRKSRATSGPMAFFTNDPAIASSYSTNKRDTSAEMPSDYAEWFKYKGKGMRSPVAIDRAWWNLSPEERAAVNERIYTIGYSDWDAGEGPIVADSQSIMPRDSIDYELRQARGNGLRALVEMWLSSGSLFNQEERFLEVLQAAGVKGATLDDPNAARSAVYPVYLSIKNPLDTANIPGDVVSALEQAGKRKRAKQSAGGNPDAWDKNTISGNDWMAALKEDMAKGTTHAWTRIPDWVTETLSSLGYDGIKDTGGKNGGVQHEVWIPFNETQVKSATGNRGTFDPTSANINYSIGIARNAISQVSDKDDASRVGTAKLGTSKVPKNTPQDSNVSGDNVPDDLLAKQMEKMNYAHLPKNILSEKDPKKKRRKLINWFKKNLLALHDAFPEEFRARATHWYDGANRIAKGMGSQFQASVEQASGVIAVFSPQKDWFMNVAQAEQFMELWTNSQDVVLEESLVRAEIEGIIEAATVADKQKRKKVDGETKEQTAERREYNKALDKLEKEKRRKIVEQVIGKTIRQLDATPTLQGWGIRVLAQVTFGRNYRNLSPEGDRLGMATNDDGALAKNGWGSINEIEKAVRIMKDGSLKNISDNLGNEHKVRNFYNNIAAPNTPYGDATIDTHAVAAAHLMPYGAKATEVGHNFGSGMNGSEVLGISGVYHLYLDAYREAAADRGILPRQMQSITWEAIRLVYPAATKNAATLAKSQKTWKDLTDANARNTLVGGRIPSPVWAGANDNRESQALSSGLQEDGSRDVSGGGLLSGVRPTGAGRDGGVNYSIASQSEIDRVNRALGGMNRGPDERLKVYERARAKFQGVMERNREALESLNKDTAKFRRTQLLQGLGELDAILSVFPPDIRGRVGGYTKLANIAPMDVFKDGEKVSEVSGMNGALISAWMRQGMSIGQAGQQTELPPGYTTKENLATARADRALADFFKQRIGMIDREVEKSLRKEYDAAFKKLLDRTKPKKAAPGEKPKGIGADIQDLFTVVRSAVEMDAVSVAAHIAGLDAKIASGELTAEQEARAQVEAALVALVGDWRNADADRRKSALDEATRIWEGAYAAHAQKVIQLREQREVARLEAIQATGKAGQLAGRKSKAIADSGLKGSWKDYILNLLNFDQVAGILFGENSETANTLIDRQRAAENAKEDGQQAKMQALEDYFTNLAGGNLLAGEQLRYNLAQPSMEVQGIKLSELEGLSAVMMWEQEDGRRHMTGELDETGNPTGAWNYDQDFVDEIMANLSPEALQLRDWLLKQYADEYGNINAVYAELNGVNLPQIRNYSPVTVQPISAPTGQVLDPVSGSAMSGASTSPGALRTRGTAIAEPRFQDVLQTYIAHTLQMEHWKAFAPYIAEANAVLRNRDVQNSVEEKGGAEARKILNAWLDYFAQGGTRDAGAHLALNQGISNVLGRASQVALIGRASTLLVQSTQLGAAVAEMPVKAYLKRMGKLLTGQLGWDAALNSPYIQRRIAQMPPVVQMAMQGLKGAKPTAIQQAGKRLGNLLSGADGLFTAGTYAITYDYHLTKAQELGLTGAEAESYARNIAERVTDRIAQPTRPGARSLYENTSTNPLARAGWAFASEARKNLALVAYSFAERPLATRMRTLAYVVALNSIASSILRSIWRDILDDEDDELFDDKYWSPKRIALAVATEPLYGFPVLGSTAQNAIYAAFGEYKPTGSMFDVDRAINPVKRIPEYLSGDFEMRDVMRDIDMIVSAMGIAHPNIAAAASITHLAKDLFNLGDSAVDAVTED